MARIGFVRLAIIVTALVTALLVAWAIQARAASEDLTIDITVLDSTPEDEEFPAPCLGDEDAATWSPEWSNASTSYPLDFDLSIRDSYVETIQFGWSDGQDEDCFPISPTGPVTTALSVTTGDPMHWFLTSECSAPSSCTAEVTESAAVNITPSESVDVGSTYVITATVTWTP